MADFMGLTGVMPMRESELEDPPHLPDIPDNLADVFLEAWDAKVKELKAGYLTQKELEELLGELGLTKTGKLKKEAPGG